MLESNLCPGRQELNDPRQLTRGVSITDPCLDFETTESLLEELANAVRQGNAARGAGLSDLSFPAA
jgi:3-deoxy-7-phosphoheptulonate synthase